jgi:NTE family protein
MQVGMLQALLGAGVVPDLVVGCSVGAINGAAIARDPTPGGAAALEALWTSMSRRDVWPVGLHRAPLRLFRRGSSVHGNEGLRAVLDRHLPATFEELSVPFACVAADLATGGARWFASGALRDPVLASAALPGLLPPVEIDGHALIDGAAVDVVPVDQAVALGAERLFVLQIKDLDALAPPPVRPVEVLVRAFAIARNARFVHDLAALPSAIEVHVLPVVEWPRLRYDGFSRSAELIASARQAAARHLEALGTAG